MSNNKKMPILQIFTAIQSGIPLAKEFFSLFKKSKKTTDGLLNGMSQQQLIEQIKELESVNDKSFLLKITTFLITATTVYFVVYLSKHFGVTYQQIIDLFGLIK